MRQSYFLSVKVDTNLCTGINVECDKCSALVHWLAPTFQVLSFEGLQEVKSSTLPMVPDGK